MCKGLGSRRGLSDRSRVSAVGGDRPFAGEGKNAGGLAYEVWAAAFGPRESSSSGPT